MNDVCRARPSSSSNSNVASLVKICRSGQNRIRVPDLSLATRPPLRVRPDFGVNAAVGPSPSKTPGHAAAGSDMPCCGRRPVDVDVDAATTAR